MVFGLDDRGRDYRLGDDGFQRFSKERAGAVFWRPRTLNFPFVLQCLSYPYSAFLP